MRQSSHTSGPLLARGRIDPADRGHEVEVAGDGHLGIEGDRLREVADVTARLRESRRVSKPATSPNRRTAGETRCEDAHRRGLAGGVGTEQSQDLAASTLKDTPLSARLGP